MIFVKNATDFSYPCQNKLISVKNLNSIKIWKKQSLGDSVDSIIPATYDFFSATEKTK